MAMCGCWVLLRQMGSESISESAVSCKNPPDTPEEVTGEEEAAAPRAGEPWQRHRRCVCCPASSGVGFPSGCGCLSEGGKATGQALPLNTGQVHALHFRPRRRQFLNTVSTCAGRLGDDIGALGLVRTRRLRSRVMTPAETLTCGRETGTKACPERPSSTSQQTR